MSAMFKVGQKVTVNGNNEGRILSISSSQYNGKTFYSYTIRLWQGFRHVGDTVLSESDLLIENKI